MRAVRGMFEDIYLEASTDADFIGVQTYTRVPVRMPAVLAPATALLAGVPALRDNVLPKILRQQFNAMSGPPQADGIRRTDMGYEYRPEAIAATLRRAAELHPGKDLIVTEHGIATDDDAERVEFFHAGLQSVADVLADGIPVRGYLAWSLLDNFEWAHGYRTRFGLVDVDRTTMARTPRPSLGYLGRVARANALVDPDKGDQAAR
jgi:beta-glucosidase